MDGDGENEAAIFGSTCPLRKGIQIKIPTLFLKKKIQRRRDDLSTTRCAAFVSSSPALVPSRIVFIESSSLSPGFITSLSALLSGTGLQRAPGTIPNLNAA